MYVCMYVCMYVVRMTILRNPKQSIVSPTVQASILRLRGEQQHKTGSMASEIEILSEFAEGVRGFQKPTVNPKPEPV